MTPWHSVEGWMSDECGLFLMNQAKASRHPIVQIGGWKGRSAVALLTGSQAGHNMPVYTVDHFLGSAEHTNVNSSKLLLEFLSNTAPYKDISKIIIDNSESAAKIFQGPIGCLFIDGSHDFESVVMDFSLWTFKMIPGAYVILHDAAPDTGWPGPKEVAEIMYTQIARWSDFIVGPDFVAAKKVR